MAPYIHSVLYFALFAAGVTCGVLHERYRIAHRNRYRRHGARRV